MRARGWIAGGALLLALAWLAGSQRDTRPDPDPAAAASARSPATEPPDVALPRVRTARPETAAPRPGPAEAPAPEPYLAVDGEPSRALVRAALLAGIADHHASHKLSPADEERITDAAFELLSVQRELRELPDDPELAERRRLLLRRIADADAAFSEVMEMSFAEFTAADAAPGGIDRDAPGERPPPPEYLEDFR